MLHRHYGEAPIIIIDEYDIPIQQGYLHGFYDQVVSFMRNFFSGGFKRIIDILLLDSLQES